MIVGGVQGGRLVAAGDGIRAWRAGVWRDHRGLTMGALGLALLGGGAFGWVRAHPPSSAVPGIAVSVDPATVAAAADVGLIALTSTAERAPRGADPARVFSAMGCAGGHSSITL